MKSFKEYILSEDLEDTFISVFSKRGETDNLTKEQIINKIIEFQKNNGSDNPELLKKRLEKKFDETMEKLGYIYKKEGDNSKGTSLYNMAKSGRIKDVLNKTKEIKQKFKDNEEIQDACKKVQDEAPKAASVVTEDNESAVTGDNIPSEPSEQIRQEFLNACKKLDDLLIKKGDNLSIDDKMANDTAQAEMIKIFKNLLEKYRDILAKDLTKATKVTVYAAKLNNNSRLDFEELQKIYNAAKSGKLINGEIYSGNKKTLLDQIRFLVSCLALKNNGSNLFKDDGTIYKDKGLGDDNINNCLKELFGGVKGGLGENILKKLGDGIKSSEQFAGAINRLMDEINKNPLEKDLVVKNSSSSNDSNSSNSPSSSNDSNSSNSPSSSNDSNSSNSPSSSNDSNSSSSSNDSNSSSSSNDSNSSSSSNDSNSSNSPSSSNSSNNSSEIRKINTGIGAIQNLSYSSSEQEIKNAVNNYYGTGDGEEERGKLYDYYSSEMDNQMKINDELYKRNQALNPKSKKEKEEKVEENLILYNIHNNKLLAESDFGNKVKDIFTRGKYDISQSKTSGSYENYKTELSRLISTYRKKVNNEIAKISKIVNTGKKADIVYKIKKITNELENDATQLFYRAKKANSYNAFGIMQHNHNINAKKAADKAKEIFDNSRAGKLSNIVKEKIQEVMKNLTPEMLDKIPDDEQGTKNGFRDTVAYVVKNFTSDSKFNAILNEPDIDNQINDKGTVKQHAIEAIQAVKEFNVAGEAEVMAFLGELVNKMKEDKAIATWIEKYNKIYEDKKLKLPLKQTIFALGDDKKRANIINKIKSSADPITDIKSSFGIGAQTQANQAEKKPEYNNPKVQQEVIDAANKSNEQDFAAEQAVSVKTESILHMSFKDYLLKEQELIGQSSTSVNNLPAVNKQNTQGAQNTQGKTIPTSKPIKFSPEQLPLLAFLLLVSGNAQGDLYTAALKNLTGSGKDNSQYSDEDKIRALNMWKREHSPMVQKITETMNALLKKEQQPAASVVTSSAVGDYKIPSRLFKQAIRRKIGKTMF